MKQLLILLCAATVVFSSCQKKEELPVFSVNDYFPLKEGKYITYAVDSSVYYTNFGASAVTKSYQVKYTVDAKITDAQNRPAWRIIRSIRTGSTGVFTVDNVFMATNTGNTIEFTENNLRYVKLVSPIRQDYTWQGNGFINTTNVPNLQFLGGWDYTYDSINIPTKIGAVNIDSVIKVAHIDNQTAVDRTFSEEKYAKGIGLVYKNTFFWYKSGSSPFSDNSFGVIMTMIDHN
jgi:hypothetical protein